MRRLASRTGLALVFLAICFPAWPADKTKPKQDLSEVRARIDKLKREIEGAEEDKADVLDSLKSSEQSISQINRSLHELAQDRREVNTSLKDAQSESTRLRNHIRSQQDVLAQLLLQQYLNGGQDTLRLMLNLQNPNEISRQVEYYGYLSRSRAQLITSLRRDLKAAEAAEATVREKHSELAKIEAQQQTEKRALQKELHNRRSTLSKLEQQIRARHKQVARLERDEKRLTQLVERLARMMATKPKSTRPLGRPKAATSNLPPKGSFKLPVAGELTNRFGGQRADTGTAWKGLFIRAGNGSPVRTMAGGRVVFADWLRGFGNLLIVDHGDGYMSLYGNNEALLKQEGAEVEAGDTVATVGNSGGNPESGLYFEVRYQSRPIDPLKWVGQ